MARKPDVPCAVCGKLLWSAPSSLPPGERTCRPCRRKAPDYLKNKLKSIGRPGKERWNCANCGVECEREWARGQKPKYCDECSPRAWISDDDRMAIYVRDKWTCGICLEGVDSDLIGTQSEWRPSIDHIVPRSQGGTDESDNLRLAHQWCNVVLADGRVYTVDDFRVEVA